VYQAGRQQVFHVLQDCPRRGTALCVYITLDVTAVDMFIGYSRTCTYNGTVNSFQFTFAGSLASWLVVYAAYVAPDCLALLYACSVLWTIWSRC
jgi:hypothetical protein